MANILLSAPNRVDIATLSGGSWSTSMPLSNLQDDRLRRFAEAVGSPATFDAALPVAEPIRVLGLIAHSLPFGSTYRVRAGNDATFASNLHDSGVLDVWPAAGNLTGNGVREEFVPRNLFHVLPAGISVSRFRVDLTNPSGTIRIGRLFLGDGFQPSVNPDWGIGVRYESRSERQEADGGADYFEKKKSRRVLRFTLPHLTRAEAFGEVARIQAVVDTYGEVVYIEDPDSLDRRPLRSIHGRLRELSEIEFPRVHEYASAFQISEII